MVYHARIDGMEEQHTKHVTYKIAYHFVWCPKFRKQVLVGENAQFVESEIRRLCEENRWRVGALHVQEDHVHVFLSAPLPFLPRSLLIPSRASLPGKSLSGFPLSRSNCGAALSGQEAIMWALLET